jgi:hypothetical protein
MQKFKKWAAALTVAAVLGAGGAAYAATSLTTAEIAANLTGKSVAELQQQRQAGQTYGAIANEAGKLEEFKAQMLEQKKVVLDERVADGKLTQEQADTIYQNMQENQANCDGSGNGNGRMGKNAGAGFGQGNGPGAGQGMGAGQGFGNRAGNCNGTCLGAGQAANK